MHSNMLCGFYQNTDPKSSFTYCFIISYSIDELYYILYVKEDTLDYIVVYKEQVDNGINQSLNVPLLMTDMRSL